MYICTVHVGLYCICVWLVHIEVMLLLCALYSRISRICVFLVRIALVCILFRRHLITGHHLMAAFKRRSRSPVPAFVSI